MAESCHAGGKHLPCGWHSLANPMAKLCQRHGKAWQKPLGEQQATSTIQTEKGEPESSPLHLIHLTKVV